ncbi:MAG: oligosaccharide flippase family protein [Alphaproteobacteria bacterium]|nr:oligosaccharide flippase family protein [Alphaproteobacteria bacterium]
MTPTPGGADHPLNKKAVVRGALVVALSRLGAVVEVVAQPAYIWMFGLATYGIYAALWAAVNIISNIADFAMTSAMQRVIPQASTEEKAHSALKTALVIGLLPSLVVAGAVSFFTTPVAALLNAAPRDQATLELSVRLFAWALPLWTFVELATSAVRARKAFGPEVRLRIFWEQIVRLLMAAAAWLAGWLTLGLVAAHLLSLLVTALLGVRLIGRYYNLSLLRRAPVDRAVMRDLLHTGLGLLPGNITTRFFSDLPPLILNLIVPGAAGANASGLYAIARKIASLPMIVRHSLHYVIQPLVAEQSVRDASHINHVYGFASRLSMSLLLPTALLIALLADEILLLFPAEARAAAPLVIILTLVRGINAIVGPANGILQMLHPRLWPTANAMAGIAGAGLVTWAATAMGIEAARAMAWGVAGGLIAMEWLPLLQLWLLNGLHPCEAPFRRGAATILGMGAFVVLLLQAVPPLPVAAEVALVLPLFFALVWLALRTALTDTERQSLGRIGTRLGLTSRACL